MALSDKQKKLLLLLADGEFRSGTDLANALGLSRSAVWKQLTALAELGLQYSAISGKGYRLNQPLELLDAQRILAGLKTTVCNQIAAFEIHDQLDSTNSYLMQKCQSGLASSFVCLAEHQTAGKGRRGREWVSPYGSNIYLSLAWCFTQSGLSEIAGLSLVIGVAVVRALKQLQIPGITLKWPNDLYYQGKKLGGILIEVSGEATGPCKAVIGIGLNVFLPVAAAEKITQPWIDLTHIVDQRVISRNDLVAALLNHLIQILSEFEHNGLSAYLDEWRSYDGLQGQSARLFIGNQVIDGTVLGIDDNGQLLFQCLDGSVRTYASGEVSFRY